MERDGERIIPISIVVATGEPRSPIMQSINWRRTMTNRFGRLALCLLAIGPCAGAQSAEAPVQLPAGQRSNGALELSVAQAPDPPLRPDLFPPDNVWHGMVVVSLTNVSPFAMRLSESALTYEFTVLDSAGRPVPPTERGKELLAAQREAHQGRPFVMGPTSSLGFDRETREPAQSGSQPYTRSAPERTTRFWSNTPGACPGSTGRTGRLPSVNSHTR